MKKQYIILVLAFLTIGVTLSSCKKGCTDENATNYDSKAKKDDDSCVFDTVNDDEHDHIHDDVNAGDSEKPSILINKPYPGMYMIDSTGILMMPISIDIDITDNEKIASVEFTLHYVNNNDSIVMMYHKHMSDDVTSFKVDTSYLNTESIYPLTMMQQNHDLIIKVEDASGNIERDTTSFFIHYMG